MANYKSRPKPYKGCCWMCAKGDRRCHRTPTIQEARAADPRPDACASRGPCLCGDCIECTMWEQWEWEPSDDVDRFMGLVPGTCVRVEDVAAPPVRVPVLTRAIVFA